jgi:hypothetical protein
MQRRSHRPRSRERQPDLFPARQPRVAEVAPGWDGLPEQARHAVTALMTRLLTAHTGGAVPKAGDDADER